MSKAEGKLQNLTLRQNLITGIPEVAADLKMSIMELERNASIKRGRLSAAARGDTLPSIDMFVLLRKFCKAKGYPLNLHWITDRDGPKYDAAPESELLKVVQNVRVILTESISVLDESIKATRSDNRMPVGVKAK
jgi:hypothetical protein